MREGAEQSRRAALSPEETRRLLEGLRERLDGALESGESVLKLGPDDLRGLCSRAGFEGDAAGAFRSLVRSNLVRLRGRWREGVSGEEAPVYVARVASPEVGGEGSGGGRAASGRPEGGGRR